ncbi:TRM11 family SAM-dependent methyltransferase [Sphingomonas sp. LR55]|uniref:TRM11 family SAM-dependent methyltransferase n=1 Tax=Sphingomonas sp. LR55 TaxID=3050231 RepID=UPI002FE24B22
MTLLLADYKDATTAERVLVEFWVTLKVDFECANERRLAELELTAILGQDVSINRGDTIVYPVEQPKVLCDAEYLYVIAGDVNLGKALRRLSYWHSIILKRHDLGHVDAKLRNLLVRETQDYVEILTASTLLERSPYLNFDITKITAKEGYLLTGDTNSLAETRIKVKGAHDRKRNVYLSHDFHKYKAKFFPRMARALINITCPDDKDILLDPFCGSGTANVEATIMGLSSVGTDIDPLSVFISQQKSNLELNSNEDVISALCNIPSVVGDVKAIFKLPKFLLRDRAVHLTGAVAEAIEAEVGEVLSRAQQIKNAHAKSLAQLCISHALATKISLRWMGTGDNRFSVEVSKRSFTANFHSQIKLIFTRLKQYISMRDAGVISNSVTPVFKVADIADLPLPSGSISGIVTSPPYLPASSGRETYLRSRAASLIALGLMSEEEVIARESGLIGSIMAKPDFKAKLPKDVIRLVEWMQPQRARGPKALPTLAYFEKMILALEQMARVLEPGGKVAFVVSRYHSFYELATKVVVEKFDMVKNIVELIEESDGAIPFKFIESINIELGKADFKARPAGQNAYFEAVILLQRL